jgi:peptidoglycan/xylan/chitin deacetylase (PgdA/CDA1 family)
VNHGDSSVVTEQQNGPLACITLDVEPDFHTFSVTPDTPRYYGLFDQPGQFDRFLAILNRHDVRLTCFVVSSVLDDCPDYIGELQAMGAEFGSHSLTHDLNAQGTEHEARGSIDAFADFFGHRPQGYRSPFGKMTRVMLEILAREGVQYDSSFMPSVSPISPRIHQNLRGRTGPFLWEDLSLLELPFSVFPTIRLPIALSYLKVLGRAVYSRAHEAFGLPDPLVTFFHPMNLVYSPEAFDRLSLKWKAANLRNWDRGFELLDWLLTVLEEAGYRFVFMSELHNLLSDGDLAQVRLPG